MRKAPKGVAIVLASGGLTIISSKRAYTPIFSPELEALDQKDHLAPVRLQEQLSLLWGASEPLVPTVVHGMQYLSLCGFDPVLQQLQLSSGTGDGITESSSANQEESSFRQFAEDYHGTNLSSPANKDHFRNSISYWTKIYEQKYSNTMRMFRRTASQHVGTVNGKDVLEDEADLPQTPWSKDTYFRELTFIAANFLKEHCTSMEELEMKLRLASADAYFEFLNVFQYQTITMIPLPSSACWYYEGDSLKDWVDRWRPMHLDRVNNFIPLLLKAARASEIGWPAVANKLADVFKAVYAIVEAREDRQAAVGGALRPLDDPTLSADEKLAKATEIIGRRLKAYRAGEFEPDDADDNSEQFLLEQIKIGELLSEPIEGLDFTAADYWKHVVCTSEIEYEHLYTSHTFKVLQAQAMVKAKCTSRSRNEYYSDIVASIRGSSLDMKNGNVIPQMNDTWCKLNWVKYGAATLTHHTPAARRQLLFHYSSLGGVKASATLHYKLQPLSSSLDYSTPYNFRRSYVNCCADYGVTMTQLDHQYHAASLMTVGKAEVLLSNITDYVKQVFGALRRSEYSRKRKLEERLLHYTDKKAKILTPLQSSMSASSSGLVNRDEEHRWAFGSKRSVQFKYDSPLLQELLRMAGRSGHDAIVKESELLRRAGAIEVCLMRKVSPEVAKARVSALEEKVKDVASIIASDNQFKLAFDHTVEYCKSVSSDIVVSKAKNVKELNFNSSKSSSFTHTTEDDLEFVTMITDCASFPVPHPTQPQTLDVLLPYRTVKDFNGLTSVITDGEYCLRLRFYDHTSNHQHDPTRCTEAFTSFFTAYNDIHTVISGALGMSEEVSGRIVKNTMMSPSSVSSAAGDMSEGLCVAGDQLIPLCNALRRRMIEVPLMVEFQAGQILSDNGEFYLDVLVDLLTGGERFASPVLSSKVAPINLGLTEMQLKLEPKIRKHWTSLVFPGTNMEEWYTMRRAVLNDAMDYELEWWREDDWLESPIVSIENFQTRLRHGNEVCHVLSARSDVTNGLDPRKMALPEDANKVVDEFETRAVLTGDGTVSSISFNSDVVKQKNASVDQLLSAATDAISRANIRLNTLAAQKLDSIAHQSTITTFLHAPAYSIFGGKYQATAGYALNKAVEELGMTKSSVEVALRDMKPVDRFASKDHPEQRKVLWYQEGDYTRTPTDDLDVNKQSDWGI